MILLDIISYLPPLSSGCAPCYKEDISCPGLNVQQLYEGIKKKRDFKVEKKVHHIRLCPDDDLAHSMENLPAYLQNLELFK